MYFKNCGHMYTMSLYRFTSSYVQRVLVHVPLYTMYYLSVVLVLDKDVARLCSYRGEEWETLYKGLVQKVLIKGFCLDNAILKVYY